MTMTISDLMSELEGQFAGLFEKMDLCERELESAGVSDLRVKDRSLFWACRPPSSLSKAPSEVYVCHVRELIQRALRGEALEPATNVECIVGMMGVALVTPINRNGLAVITELVKGTPFESIWEGQEMSERYAGKAAEDIADMRKKLAVADRCVP